MKSAIREREVAIQIQLGRNIVDRVSYYPEDEIVIAVCYLICLCFTSNWLSLSRDCIPDLQIILVSYPLFPKKIDFILTDIKKTSLFSIKKRKTKDDELAWLFHSRSVNR